MGAAERLLGAVIARNNSRVRSAEGTLPNPRDLATAPWHAELVGRAGAIRSEWDTFIGGGGQLPLIDEVLGEHQGNEGPWRAGVLISDGRPSALAREAFPTTLAALSVVPGLKAALWSVLDPGTELVEHRGPNAGVLRYHLGIDCPDGAALVVDGTVVPYVDDAGTLFDDTVPHAAWNRSDRRRITLFCEVERPLPGRAAILNRLVQRLIAADPRRRGIVATADSWHAALNRSSG